MLVKEKNITDNHRMRRKIGIPKKDEGLRLLNHNN